MNALQKEITGSSPWRIGPAVPFAAILGLSIGISPAPAAEAAPVRAALQREVERLTALVEARPRDPLLLTRLAEAQLQEATATGDPAGYRSAEALAKRVLAASPNDFAALTLKSWAEYGQHRFEEALATAKRASAAAPSAARPYALIADALMELGRYEAAAEALQKMLELRPGPDAYTRTAHWRYLHGDLEGARELVEAALRSALGGNMRPMAAWLYVQAAEIHAARGDCALSRRSLELALKQMPGHAGASELLANILVRDGKPQEARGLLEQALEQKQAPALLAALETARERLGDEAGVAAARKRLEELARLDEARHGRVDRALALADLDRGRHLERALEAARQDHAERPSVESADVLAWALFRNGHIEEALRRSDEASRLGTPGALLALHRGRILQALGRDSEARVELGRARERGCLLAPVALSEIEGAGGP